MKRPLVCLSLIYGLGILFADKIKISPPFLYVVSAVSLVLCLLFIRKCPAFNIFLSCLIFALGGVALKNSQNLSENHISKFVRFRNNDSYIVKGCIVNKPLTDSHKTSFVLKAQAVSAEGPAYSCAGNILVQLRTKKKFFLGEELILRGRLYRPFYGSGKSYRDYLHNRDIWFLMNVKTGADIIRLDKNRGFVFKRLAVWLEGKMEEILFRYASPLAASILDAMILGGKKQVPWFVKNAMMKSGTIHILVVSGFHVGIVSFVIMLFLKLLRIPKGWRYCITIGCLVVYCLMVGASTPVVRATLMAIVFILGALAKREPDARNGASLAFLILLLFNPRQLFDIGFQLSFACVFSLVYLYPKIRTVLRIQSIHSLILRLLFDGFLISLSCWLATLGLIATSFKIFSPVTVLANVFIVPLATLITLSGFSLLGAGCLLTPLAPFFANTCDFLVMILVRVNAFLVNLPMAYFYLG
jgi:competence protein ComEC